MNVWQLSQQIVFALNPTNLVWPDAPSEPVLSRVIVGPPPPDFFQHDLVAPAAILHVEAGRDHEEHPADLTEEARWSLYLFAANATEQAGSAAVMGGNRSTLGSSRGRGLLEIEALVKTQLFNQLGLTARPRSVGSQATNSAGKMGGLIAERALEILASRIPSMTDFSLIRKLQATGLAGTATLSWTNPPSRWDLTGVVVRRGTSFLFPANPDQGVGVPVVGLASSVMDTPPIAGVWKYAVFSAFDATLDPFTGAGAGSPNRFSGYFSSDQVPPAPPASFVVTPTVAGIIDVGVHEFRCTFLVNGVESLASAAVAVSFVAGRRAVFTAVPIGPTGTTERRLYMTPAGAATPLYKCFTIGGNVTTSGTINLTDSTLANSNFPTYGLAGFVFKPALISVTV